MYFGDSDGSDPFIGGLIEDNEVIDTIGYNLQIKHQAVRPNVLVGHLPLAGPGQEDEYAIYANLFFQNPGEALFQGEGNLALYSNLFFNRHAVEVPAIAIQPHNDIPRRARVFVNTVLHPWKGIQVLRREDRWEDDQLLIGNAVFAETPLQGGTRAQNLTDDYAAAAKSLQRPVPDLTVLDLSPRENRLLGGAIDLSLFS